MPDKFTPNDTGCIFDGVHGQLRNDGKVIDLAVSYGYEPDTSGVNHSSNEFFEWQSIEADYATDYLNDHAAPDGCHFEWIDGDFVLLSDDETEE